MSSSSISFSPSKNLDGSLDVLPACDNLVEGFKDMEGYRGYFFGIFSGCFDLIFKIFANLVWGTILCSIVGGKIGDNGAIVGPKSGNEV
jgi:hypothetical protein